MDDTTSETPTPSVVEDDDVSSEGQRNSGKRVFINEMPVGSEDGKHGWFSKAVSPVIYHTNVSVESDEGVTTSGLGRQDNGSKGDMPIGVPTTSHDQAKRNEDEEKEGNLRKVPVEEYMGGKYAKVDPDVLEARLKEQTEKKEPQGAYGKPRLDSEGHPRLNICWTHTNDNLHESLPESEKERLREEEKERCRNFDKHVESGGSD